MERKIWEFFESETMPEDCARRIEDRITHPSHPRRVAPLLRLSAGLAMFILLTAMFVSPDWMVAFAGRFYPQTGILPPAETSSRNEFRGEYTIISKNSENSTSHGTYQIQLLLPDDEGQNQPFFISNQHGIDVSVLHSGISAHIYAMLE